MKKLLLVIPIALYLFVVAYSMDDPKEVNAVSDLAYLKQLETQAAFDKLNYSGTELLTVLEKQEKLVKAMDDHIYNGSLNYSDIDCKQVLELTNYKSSFKEKAAIFQGKAYKAYFEIRTRKALEEYEKTGVMNLKYVVSNNRNVFDSFLTEYDKNATASKELTLLLQNKLMDRLVYDSFPDKGKYFYEVLSLRKQDKENSLKRNDYLYQLFESRARLEMLDYAINKNKLAIYEKTKAIGVKLYSGKEYKLTFGADNNKTAEFFKGKEVYWTMIPLWELVDFNTAKRLYVTTDQGSLINIYGKTALDLIYIDNKLQLSLDLNKLMTGGPPGTNEPGSLPQVQEPEAADYKQQEKTLAAQCAAKASAGRVIAKEINKYGLYVDAKNNRKDSLYVREFERNKKAWQAELKRGLKLYDPAGGNYYEKMRNLVIFNKILGDFYDSGNFEDRGSIKSVVKYREQVLQFRPFQEGELWLLDMAYELWNNGEMQ